MAVMEDDPEVKSAAASVSFKFSSKVQTSKLTATSEQISKDKKREENREEDEEEEKDFLISASGKELQSAKPKVDKAKLVIPLIKKNNWRLPEDAGSSASELDKEAVSEILKDLRNETDEDAKDENFTIPMLMRNKLPVKTESGISTEKFDISIRPEGSTVDDYEDVPVSSFGSAMLRGMGWSEGTPLGSTNKGLTEPIEYIPRHKGLGLGADKKPQDNSRMPDGRKRINKPGDKAEEKAKRQRYVPIVEADGRVRHVKGLSEVAREQPKGFHVGAYVCVGKGIHHGLYATVVGVDEDNARVSAKLAISGEVISISQHCTTLITKAEFAQGASSKPNAAAEVAQKLVKKTSNNKPRDVVKVESDDDEDDVPCWLRAGIRVRIISKSFRRGTCYNKKVEILDVTSTDSCSCRTEDGKLLDNVKQSDLETIVPKEKDAYVMIVGQGKYSGMVGKVHERDKRECKATIQLTSDKRVTTQNYDCISEFVGKLSDDDFL